MDERTPITLRIPAALHEMLQQISEQDERSVNWLIVDAIRKYLMVPR